METKNIMSIMVVALVGAVILTGFLPVLGATQDNIGEPITLKNNSNIVLREVVEGDVLAVERTVIAENTFKDVWTLNDDEITTLSGTTVTWNVGIISDGIYMQINSASNAAGSYYKMNQTTPSAQYFGVTSTVVGSSTITSFTFANGEVTVNYAGATSTVSYTWGYVVCNLEDGSYYSAETGGVGICKKASDLILCGAYTSGELDTMYSYVNGVGYVSNSAYTMTVDADLTKHAGTTDIYDITTSVVMSDGANDETFTPYRVFLPYEVTGHQTVGAMYDIYGLIPLIVTVGLLMFAITAILIRRV